MSEKKYCHQCIYLNDEFNTCFKLGGITEAHNRNLDCMSHLSFKDVTTLQDRLAESAGREQSLMLQLGERDKCLAEAETSLKIANEGLNATNKLLDEYGDRLRTASEFLKKFCPNEIEECEGHCNHQDSNPCENYKLWVTLRGEAGD